MEDKNITEVTGANETPEANTQVTNAVEVAEAAAPVQAQAQQAVQEVDEKFTPEEMQKIRQFAQTIDLKDTGTVLQYGNIR